MKIKDCDERTTRELLVDAIMGTSLYSLDLMNNPLVKKCGTFTGGFCERWDWDRSKIEALEGYEIVELYRILKKKK